MRVFRQSVVENPAAILHQPERTLTEHRRILAALEQRDIAAARAAMHRHFGLQDFLV